MELDAKTFAEWDVDYVKLDGCNADAKTMDVGYPKFGEYLNQTGRPMVYSCSWPVYQEEEGMQVSHYYCSRHQLVAKHHAKAAPNVFLFAVAC